MNEHNAVRLAGVVVLDPVPFGESELTWRVRVARAGGGQDHVPCRGSAAARWAGKLAAGDWVEIEGELRSRYWRSGDQTQSRVEVEVTHLRRRRGRSGS